MRTLLLLCFLLSFGAFAQTIPNADFESWYADNWQLVPEFWDTQNTGEVPMTTQDLDAFQGDYAMRVTALPDGIGFTGWSTCTIPTESIPASLDFYVKSLCEFGAVSVSISFYNNDLELYTEFWNSGESISEWTFVSLPLAQLEPVMTHAVIRVEAFVGDLVPGQAWISVDAMGFEGTLNSNESETINFELFPNPATDWLQISGDVNGSQLSIFDLTGKVIQRKIITSDRIQIETQNLPAGIYLVEIKAAENFRSSQKLVKR